MPYCLCWAVAQLCLWSLYTRITLPTLLNKIKELTHVGTYNCVVCTPANPSSKNKYVYAKHFNFVWIYTRIYDKKLPVRHYTMILMEVLYPTTLDTHTHTHTPKVWFGPWVWFIPCLAGCFVFHTIPITVQEMGRWYSTCYWSTSIKGSCHH
jgi:hypothetical protein